MAVTPFRSLITQPGNAPSSMRDGTSERLFYTFGLMADARLERLTQGIKARIPRSTIANYQAPDDALAIIGSDRGPIIRGPNETSASYALRVQQAPSEWQIWGSPRACLDQLCAYFTPAPVTCRIVTNSGHWYSMSSPGVVTPSGVVLKSNQYTILPPTARPPAVASNWSWDGLSRWWRSWVIVHLPVGYLQGFNWDGGPAWDSGPLWDGIPQSTLDQLVTISNLWFPEHCGVNGSLSGLIVTQLQPTDLIPGQAVRPFDPSSVNTTNADHSTNLPIGNWGSQVYTSGPFIGFNSRPPWATFYNINNG